MFVLKSLFLVYVCKSEAAKKRSDVSESDFKKRNDAFFARGGINEIIARASEREEVRERLPGERGREDGRERG